MSVELVYIGTLVCICGLYLYGWFDQRNKARKWQEASEGWEEAYALSQTECVTLREQLMSYRRPGRSMKYDYMVLAEDVGDTTETSILYYAPDGEEALIAFHDERREGWPANETWKTQKIDEHQARLRALRAMGEI